MMTTLSARQYPLLRLFAVKMGENKFMSLQEAATLNQTTFRSLLLRGWIRYEKGYGFTVTHDGREAWHAFGHTSFERVTPGGPLCAWFYQHNPVDTPQASRSTGQRKRV